MSEYGTYNVESPSDELEQLEKVRAAMVKRAMDYRFEEEVGEESAIGYRKATAAVLNATDGRVEELKAERNVQAAHEVNGMHVGVGPDPEHETDDNPNDSEDGDDDGEFPGIGMPW